MRKRIFILFCAGIMMLSIAGCENKKDDKKERKENTETSGGDLSLLFGNLTEESDTEEPDTEEPDTQEPDTEEPDTEEPDTEEPVTDSDWVMAGCEETGYLEVPAGWTEHESTASGDRYSLQYISPAEDGMISVFKNNYNYDADLYDVEDPVSVVMDAYLEQYEGIGAENIETGDITINGIDFMKSVDCIPSGGLTDYDYYIYTYVAYTNRFYSLIIEGDKSVIEESVKKAEETFYIVETGGEGENSNTPSGSGTASSNWESYEVVIDGEVYTLPCAFSELENNGWSLDAYYEDEIIAYDDYSFVTIVNGEKEISVVVANQNSPSDILAAEGQLIGVCIDYRTEEMDCAIAGNITLGASYDDVIGAFGTPDEVYEYEDDYKVIEYESDADYRAGLEVTIDGGKVTNIQIIGW